MRERPTISHGLCHVCAVCGRWVENYNPKAFVGSFFGPIYWDSPAPPEALHHRQPSLN